MAEDESQVLFVLNGLERSGMIWATRLLADSLQVAVRSRYHVPPFTTDDDPAVWHLERPGRFIRRLHYFVQFYPYEVVPCVVLQRDPRDVAVSQVEAGRLDEPLCDYTRRLLSAWIKFHLEWLEDRRRASVLCYEDLLRDPEREVARVLQEVGCRFDLRDVRRAVAEHEFSVMVNKYKGRHGADGAWREMLPKGCARELWGAHGETMENFGYGEKGVLYAE